MIAHRAVLAPRERLRAHGHAAAHLCLVVGGGFDERLAAGRESCDPGTLRLSRPGTLHDLAAGPDGADCWVLEAEGRTLAGIGREPSRFVRGAGVIAPLVHVLAARPDDAAGLELAVLELGARVERRRRRPRDLEPPPWLIRAREELAEAERLPLLSDVARECGVHPCHLARAFREHFGLSAGQWFRLRRLHRAADRLARTSDAVGDVAAAEGFADQAHLTRQFRRHFGAPPEAWRRERKSRSRHDPHRSGTLGPHPEGDR